MGQTWPTGSAAPATFTAASLGPAGRVGAVNRPPASAEATRASLGTRAEQEASTRSELPILQRYVRGAGVQQAVDAAVAYAQAQGYLSGLAAIDMVTGQAYSAGLATAYFPTESTIKVLLAANLLATGKMTGETEATARTMIQASDDAAANRLYWAAGGDGVLAWAAARYGIANLGTAPALGPGWWGSFGVTPLGFAQFLAAARTDPAVGPWLYDAMAGIRDVASDGTNQVFGLHAADPGGAVKQGWGGDVPGGNATMTPSVGWVADGHWAVALFTGHVPMTPYAASMAVSTTAANILLAALR